MAGALCLSVSLVILAGFSFPGLLVDGTLTLTTETPETPGCKEIPESVCGKLEIKQEPVAEYDQSTDEWKVALTCGTLTRRGNPPVDVIWKTPSGKEVSSTSYADGNFRLLLANPVSGGTYTCHLPRHSPAATCLPADSGLLRTAEYFVDKRDARMLVLEAQLNSAEEAQTSVSDRLSALSKSLRLENEAIADENKRLNDLLDSLEAKQNNLTRKDEIVLEILSALETAGELSNVTERVTSLEHWANRSVSFTAVGAKMMQFSAGQTAIIKQQYGNNIGGAYDQDTGVFTVPVDGLYYFAGSTGSRPTVGGTQRSNMTIMVDGSDRLCNMTAGDGFSEGWCDAAVHLAAGQTVTIVASANSTFEDNHVRFMGMLVNADL